MNKQLFSKIFKFNSFIKKFLKIPFFLNEILKIKILQYIPNNINYQNKLVNFILSEFCLKAALISENSKLLEDTLIYCCETVSKELAQEYLEIIKEKYGLKNNET